MTTLAEVRRSVPPASTRVRIGGRRDGLAKVKTAALPLPRMTLPVPIIAAHAHLTGKRSPGTAARIAAAEARRARRAAKRRG